MKKKFMLGMVCLLLVGCSNNESKEATNYDSFNSNGVSNGYTIVDTIDDYSENSYIVSSYKATLDDITIEFITYDNEDNAEKVLESHIESFNLLKSTGASEKETKGANYHRYFLVSNNYYMISSRIDNTLVFTKTSLTNKDKVEEFFNSIGY